MKQILLYQPIFSFIAEEFITAINDLNGEDATIRVNSPGGSVFSGWGMAAALTETKSKIKVKVDGVAASMAFYLLLFANDVEALDVSRFMIHRADGYAENDEDRKLLSDVNKALRQKMEEKLDASLFEEITGVSFDALFNDENRKDVWLNAKQAKQIGLINKINRLTPKEQTAMSKMVASSSLTAEWGEIEEDADTVEAINLDNIINFLKR